MSQPIAIPSTPSGTASPSSVDSPTLPRTPITPANGLQPMALPEASMALAVAANSVQQSNAAKRKPSRRANTAERRATHNAVERQRRETLNSRFLDLAGLLPNLSQIRRPSKSAIVNSSIAHVHASRRHRMLAARELRLLKLEADALRREINQWRDRAGLPQVEEPVRSDAFSLVLSGDLELEADLIDSGMAGYGQPGTIDEEDGYDGMYDEGDDDYPAAPPQQQQQQQQQPAMNMGGMMNMGMNGGLGLMSPQALGDEEAMSVAMFKQSQAQQNPFAHNLPSGNGLSIRAPPAQAHLGPMSGAPHSAHAFAASPTTINFDGSPALQFDSHRLQPYGHPAHAAQHNTAHFVHGLGALGVDTDKAWGAQFGAGGMFTPPASAHGPNFAMMRQQALMQQGHVFGSPVDGDDGASVASSNGGNTGAISVSGRQRSASSASASPRGTGSAPGSFEVPSLLGAGEFGHGARHRGMSQSANGTPGSWDGAGLSGMRTSPIQIPVAGGAFSMML